MFNWKTKETNVCVYYCSTSGYYKAVRGGGEEESGEHVLRENYLHGTVTVGAVDSLQPLHSARARF